MPEKHDSKDKPLYKMTLPELQTEHSYREAIRHACDRDDQKLHRILKSNVTAVERIIERKRKGLPMTSDDLDD